MAQWGSFITIDSWKLELDQRLKAKSKRHSEEENEDVSSLTQNM